MDITYENEWGYTEIHVDISVSYEEDYRIRMLEHSEMKSLIRLRGSGRDEGSRYTFSLESGMISMKKQFSEKDMKKSDILGFTEQLIVLVSELEDHFLDPGELLLTPELIFIKEGIYYFCYLPVKQDRERKSLCTAFHEITEYFVKKLDYQDTEGVFLVYRLHKETMEENYELKKIIQRYEDEYKERCRDDTINNVEIQNSEDEEDESLGSLSKGAVFSVDDGDKEENSSGYCNSKRMESIADSSDGYGPFRKVIRKIRTGYWGEWDDLITEMDRHK